MEVPPASGATVLADERLQKRCEMEAFLLGQFEKFLLILARVSGIFFITPFFGSALIPMRVKAGLALFISLLLFPVITPYINYSIPQSPFYYGIFLLSQVLIGMMIGFLLYLVVSAFQISGEFYSITMGYGIANVFDPLAQIEQPLIGQLLALFALFAFISIEGPQMVIIGICHSFDSLPGLNLEMTRPISDFVVQTFAGIFVSALKIGMPIIGILLLVMFAMGLLSKAAPMINIMIVGFPITIVIGLLTLMFIIPMLYNIVDDMCSQIFIEIKQLCLLLGKK